MRLSLSLPMMVLAGVVVVASCVALLWVWGWTNDRCPPDMLYPVRSDPLVIAVSSEDVLAMWKESFLTCCPNSRKTNETRSSTQAN